MSSGTTNPLTDAELFSAFSDILMDALRVTADRITPGARIFKDLGAESIDLLDIQFRAEHVFGIIIDSDELQKRRRQNPEMTADDITVGALVEYIKTLCALKGAQ